MHRLTTHLTHKLIPFWQSLKDDQHGGFFGHVCAETLKADMNSDKSLIYTARYLWTFSALARQLNPEWLDTAHHAYRFLKHYQDYVHGGYVYSVSYDGVPTETDKHVYAQAFIIYALSEYSLATQNPNVLKEALELYDLIEVKSYKPNGLYHESFECDWTERENIKLGGPLVAPATMNTLLHLLEAYTNLYIASQNDAVKRSVQSLINVFKTYLYNRDNHQFHMFLDEQGIPLDNGVSYGHDIEAVWLLKKATSAIHCQDTSLDDLLIKIGSKVYEEAFSSDSLLNEKIDHHVDDTRIWWVQAEALVGFHEMYTMTLDERYLQATQRIYGFIHNYLVDPRENSEWFWAVDGAFKPLKDRGIAESWKGPYHNVRAHIELIKRGLSYE